ncbi:MAG: transglutaminase domain-containing protein [Chloroflexi bacterium]|nr:transglutaminase domain-containing protein [Chloroflexota bacterium]
MRTAWRIALSTLWLLLICYPNPRLLWRSIQHTVKPPVDPEAVRQWAGTLPGDPVAIERAVHERVQYAIPWQTFRVPWVFASPAQTLAIGYGDCQARAVVLASVLAAKGIPHQLRASIDHMWVDYPGKQANVLENDAKTFWSRHPPAGGAEGGGFHFRLPQIDWAETYRIEKEYFWDAAPLSRRLALVAGLAIIWLFPLIAWPLLPRRVPPHPPAPSPTRGRRGEAPTLGGEGERCLQRSPVAPSDHRSPSPLVGEGARG